MTDDITFFLPQQKKKPFEKQSINLLIKMSGDHDCMLNSGTEWRGGGLYTESMQKVVIKWTGFHLKNRPTVKTTRRMAAENITISPSSDFSVESFNDVRKAKLIKDLLKISHHEIAKCLRQCFPQSRMSGRKRASNLATSETSSSIF